MTAPIVVSETGETRGLGWDINTSFSSNRGELFPLGSFGHTGFTGTSIWIDRVSQTFVIFLSNRVHPDGKGDVTPLRAKVATVVASAIEDTPIEKWKQVEAEYNTAVAAQLPGFIERVRRVSGNNQLSTIPKNATVLNGIDILERDKFKQLDGIEDRPCYKPDRTRSGRKADDRCPERSSECKARGVVFARARHSRSGG